MKLLFIDMETGGLDSKVHGILQIAGIVDIDGEVKEEFDFRCRPVGEVTDEALKVSGIKRGDIEGYEYESLVFHKLKNILSKHIDRFDRKDKFYATGQNVKFDMDFLKEMFVRQGDKYIGSFIHYHLIDLIPISVLFKLAGRLQVDNFKLESIMDRLGYGSQSHDALDDARNVRKAFYEYLSWLN